MSPTSFHSLLDRAGISLADLGIADIVLVRSDALRAVELLKAEKRIILGGDAYYRRGTLIVHALANWYVEPGNNEADEELRERNVDCARRFIQNFPASVGASEGDEPLFSFVTEG